MQTKTKIVSSHTADSKPVKQKQEVNGTVILLPLVFPANATAQHLQGMPEPRVENSEQWPVLSTCDNCK